MRAAGGGLADPADIELDEKVPTLAPPLAEPAVSLGPCPLGPQARMPPPSGCRGLCAADVPPRAPGDPHSRPRRWIARAASYLLASYLLVVGIGLVILAASAESMTASVRRSLWIPALGDLCANPIAVQVLKPRARACCCMAPSPLSRR